MSLRVAHVALRALHASNSGLVPRGYDSLREWEERVDHRLPPRSSKPQCKEKAADFAGSCHAPASCRSPCGIVFCLYLLSLSRSLSLLLLSCPFRISISAFKNSEILYSNQ